MPTPLRRSLFDLDPAVVWVMHCAEGPVPTAAAAAVSAFLAKELRPWQLSFKEWLETPERVRALAGRLLGAPAEDVTFTASTSAALTTLAQVHPWQPGDEVVVPLGEYPSNAWPWKAVAGLGVAFREAPLWPGHRAGADALLTTPPTSAARPEDALLQALGPRTRVLAVSWVRFQDGLKLDLERLGRECVARGVDLVVDAIQGAGTMPLVAPHAAAVATSVHKGLLAPQGVGLMWTSAAFREKLRPAGSWLSVEQGADFSRPPTDLTRGWLHGGRKLEQGWPGSLMLVALEQSLAMLDAAGPAAIAAHVADLQRRLLTALAQRGPWAEEARRLLSLLEGQRLGPILGFHHGGRGAAWVAAQVQRGVERGVFASVREGYLRVALHGWHDETDVDRVVEWLTQAS